MNILVAYEGSEASEKALVLAGTYARTFGAKVYVVTSLVGGTNVAQETLTQAEESLERVQNRFKEEQVTCETRLLVRGLEPGEDVVTFANETGIDQIIIGLKRTSKVGKLLFGSNAQYIILHARCPVVTVK